MTMAMTQQATKLTMMATTTTMATGDNDDNGDDATGNGTTGYDEDDDGNGNNDDKDDDNDGDDDGGRQQRQRGQWQRHAAFLSRGYNKGVAVKDNGEGNDDGDGNDNDNDDGNDDCGGRRQQRGVSNARRRRRIVVSLPLMTIADALGGYGASNRPMVTSNGSAPHEALVVLHRAMRATLHQCIPMVIETASKPSVFFFIDM
jgi:hypothetical protein